MLKNIQIASSTPISASTARASAAERGDFIARVGGMRIDVFVPSVPLSESAARRVRRGA
jgi:hypothetical protein